LLRLAKRTIERAFRSHGFHIVRIEPPPERRLKAESLAGWFGPDECRRLYMLTAMTSGPILEIGHFLGRSTACICEAIQDVGKPREFVSYDLRFRTAEEFKAHYDAVHKADVSVPDLYRDIVFSQNTTTTEIAMRTLEALCLDGYVRLVSGNFIDLDHSKYDLIFCDAVHDRHEIEANLPHIVARSNRGCVWAFHDMHQSNRDVVLSLADAQFSELTDTLGVFVYMGK
jgi:predicted O-methyltransferase YrrM